jgi:putative endopeptidase
MRRLLVAPLLFSFACHHSKGSATSAAPPEASGIEESAIDKTVSPCEDFYEYACGSWIKKTEIPSDKASWMRSFSEIEERNEKVLRDVLEEAAKNPNANAEEKKLGDFYSACMAEQKIEGQAAADLASLLGPIEAVKDVPSLSNELAHLHLGGANALFAFGSQQDFKDATQVVAGLDQGGLGLPERDYYLREDAKSKEILKSYEAHVKKMLELSGVPTGKSEPQAQTVLKIEHGLAEASMPVVERRDPKKLYHRLDLAGIQKKAPKFPWKDYFKTLGHPDISQINVAVPEFFAAMNKMLTKVSIADWKTYLRWHAIHSSARTLSKPFVDENFAFYGKRLQGTAELEPRWKRCVGATDHALGHPLAKLYIKKTFGAAGKTTTQEMVAMIEAAMRENLEKLPWMDDATRKAALEKLTTIANKIGYPDKWIDYSKLQLGRDSYLQNDMKASEFETHRDLDKVGKPLDRTEWLMTPPTVNAYYDPSMNEMVFPAGILQPPFFARQASLPVNYGAIGMVMGHELTHGFDDEGRQYDSKGNLKDWWSPKVSEEFDRRAMCVAKQFDGYTAVDDLKVNGKLTLGENIADLAGIKLAYKAYLKSHKPSATPTGSFSDDQLFFLGTAQSWCGKRRDAVSRERVFTDPHSPPRYRINGPLSNMPEFAAAFQCKPGAKMVRKDPCTIW